MLRMNIHKMETRYVISNDDKRSKLFVHNSDGAEKQKWDNGVFFGSISKAKMHIMI